jgi:hypothetical protein
MGQLLAALVGLRKEGRKEEAAQEIERLCLESLGLSWRAVRQASPEALIEQLQTAGALRHHRAVLLGELLMHEAEMAEEDGRISDAIRARLQAFCIVGEVMGMLSEEDLAAYRPKLDRLVEQLEPVSGHPYLREKLRRYRGASH